MRPMTKASYAELLNADKATCISLSIRLPTVSTPTTRKTQSAFAIRSSSWKSH